MDAVQRAAAQMVANIGQALVGLEDTTRLLFAALTATLLVADVGLRTRGQPVPVDRLPRPDAVRGPAQLAAVSARQQPVKQPKPIEDPLAQWRALEDGQTLLDLAWVRFAIEIALAIILVWLAAGWGRIRGVGDGRRWWIGAAITAALAGCTIAPATQPAPSTPPVPATVAVFTAAPATALLFTAAPVTPQARSATPTRPSGSAACRQPIESYERSTVNGEPVNRRTARMLETASEIHPGPGDLQRVVQGSYTDAVDASFGTHAGGGAVDISIRDPANPSMRLFDEVEPMVRALRQAGFAAWYRATDELHLDSPPHIHAIAVGDRELSEAARLQIDGPSGYFRGMNGLPRDPPEPDRHGGPIVCPWMVELGYAEVR
jgi:hypothetical protein